MNNNNPQESKQQLFLNTIPFRHPVDEISIVFTTQEIPGYIRFRGNKVPPKAQTLLNKKLPLEEQFLYTNYNQGNNQETFNVNVAEYLNIARCYYTHLIENYFVQKSIIVSPNFLQDNEIWVLESTANTKYNTYSCYVLRVQFGGKTKQPLLQISYEGKAKISKRSVFDLTNDQIDSKLFNWVQYQNKIQHIEDVTTNPNVSLDEVYPVVGKKLGDKLGFKTDKKDGTPKYQRHHDNIVSFFNEYINVPDFLQIIPHAGNWQTIEQSHTFRTSINSNLMVYAGGQHKGHTPKDDIKKGPYLARNTVNLKFIFIVHEKEVSIDPEIFKNTASGVLFNYLKGDLGFFSISKYLKLPLAFDKERHITFTNADNPLPEVLENLSKITFPSEYKYIALYISPFGKDKTTSINENVYYRIKEELLKKRVVSQVIERETIFDENFKYSICNIGIAILAKQGSIPWRLDRPADDELIVGVGAFCPKKFETRYLGSAFCFANDGTFKGFNAFPETNLFALAGSIREAVQRFHSENKQAKRLVIHFYKKISKREVNAILKELREKLKLDIPVVILTINKTESRDMIVFDPNYPQKMPLSGTFVPVAFNTFLLCNNTRYSDNPISNMDGYPLPIKIKIQCTDETIISDTNTIKELIEQAYQFSRIYWKSVKQQNLPVTIKYPEMIAQMLPYFKDKKIPEFGKDNLWFL